MSEICKVTLKQCGGTDEGYLALCRKLSELEDQVSRASAGRARHAAGTNCGCCTLLLHRYTIPEYLRSWDL